MARLTPLLSLVLPDQPVPIDHILVSDPLPKRNLYAPLPKPSGGLVLVEVVSSSGPVVKGPGDDH